MTYLKFSGAACKWVGLLLGLVLMSSGGSSLAQNMDGVLKAKEVAQIYRKAHEKEILINYMELLSLPNWGENDKDIRANAKFIRALMEKRGISTRLLEVEGSPPAIYGELLTPGAKKTITIYVHYDGQNVNPANWKTPPYVATLRSGKMEEGGKILPRSALDGMIDPNWRVYGRSASDDKAPIPTMLAALDALKEAGIKLGANFKFFFEGEEELGSSHLVAMLQKYKDLLKSDFWLFFDGPQDQRGNPRVVLGVRGTIGAQLTIYGPISGLHSGHYGNFAPNPISRMANLLSSMRNDDGRILIEGFYDDVIKPSKVMLDLIKAIPEADDDVMDAIQVGDREHKGMRYEESLLWPALNFQGFQSGNIGDKSRNVIEPEAQVALGIRLVPGQTKAKTIERVENHIKAQGYRIVRDVPDKATRIASQKLIRVNWGTSGYEAMQTSPEEPLVRNLIEVMQTLTNGETLVYPLLGGSLPLIHIKRELGTPLVVLPIANQDNSQHAANENIRIGHLWKAIEIYAAIFTSLGAE